MKHRATRDFWKLYRALPARIRTQADRQYQLMRTNPRHPSMHLKIVGRGWTVRITRNYRAVAVEYDDEIIWFWIGTHAEYDRLIAQNL